MPGNAFGFLTSLFIAVIAYMYSRHRGSSLQTLPSRQVRTTWLSTIMVPADWVLLDPIVKRTHGDR
jgi:hypothetical protein